MDQRNYIHRGIVQKEEKGQEEIIVGTNEDMKEEGL